MHHKSPQGIKLRFVLCGPSSLLPCQGLDPCPLLFLPLPVLQTHYVFFRAAPHFSHWFLFIGKIIDMELQNWEPFSKQSFVHLFRSEAHCAQWLSMHRLTGGMSHFAVWGKTGMCHCAAAKDSLTLVVQQHPQSCSVISPEPSTTGSSRANGMDGAPSWGIFLRFCHPRQLLRLASWVG